MGEHSSLDQAPDMYVIRTDGFTCTRERWRSACSRSRIPPRAAGAGVARPPKRIFIVKKLGSALLRNLIEVAHAFMSMGFEVIVESSVMEEMRRDEFGTRRGQRTCAPASTARAEEASSENLADPAETASAADVRDAVLAKVGTIRVDESDGRIPREDWGTVDLVVCLGGDGVILRVQAVQGPVPR